MRAQNYHVYSSDNQKLRDLAEEYTKYLGRTITRTDGHLVVHAFDKPKAKQKKKARDEED